MVTSDSNGNTKAHMNVDTCTTDYLKPHLSYNFSNHNVRLDKRDGRDESSSKLLLTRALARIALRLRHSNALLNALLLPQVVLNGSLRRSSVRLGLA